MLKLLIHKQLSEIFRAYLYDAKKNKTRSKGATAAYIVLFVLIMAGMLGGMFTYLSLSICEPLSAAGMDWLYFAGTDCNFARILRKRVQYLFGTLSC